MMVRWLPTEQLHFTVVMDTVGRLCAGGAAMT